MFATNSFDRRKFLRATALAVAAAQLGPPKLASAQSASKPTGSTDSQQADTFGPLRQIDADELNAGYVDAGPSDAPVVMLLHGWPYDIHSFADATPLRAVHPHMGGVWNSDQVQYSRARRG